MPSVQRYRVLIVCYVRCARCPQMLCACVSLCLRSVGRSPSCAKMRRAKYRTQASVSAEKRKSTESSVFIVEVVTETCSTAIVTEGQSRATDGARPNNASIVACKLNNLQGEFKFGVRKKKKKHEKFVLIFLWCGHRDLNSDGVTIRPSNVRVCLFRHDRLTLLII